MVRPVFYSPDRQTFFYFFYLFIFYLSHLAKKTFRQITCFEPSGKIFEVTLSRDVFIATRDLIIVTFDPFRQVRYVTYHSLLANQILMT